jgi:parallel beta-helix repeat protein
VASLPIRIIGESSTLGGYEDISVLPRRISHATLIWDGDNSPEDSLLSIGGSSLVENLEFLAGNPNRANGKFLYDDAALPEGTKAVGIGLRVTGKGSRVTNCAAEQATMAGFCTVGGATNEFFHCMACKNMDGFKNTSSDSLYATCYAHHNARAGFSLEKGNYTRIINSRIEWNAKYGIFAKSGENQFTGNLFDRNGWAGLCLDGGWGATVSGNYFSRNGAGGDGKVGRWRFSVPRHRSYVDTPRAESCHIKLHYQRDVAICGNRFRAGYDDSRGGAFSPASVFYDAGANAKLVLTGNAGCEVAKGGFGGYNADYPGGGSLYFPANSTLQ